jgi:hypothetical protein
MDSKAIDEDSQESFHVNKSRRESLNSASTANQKETLVPETTSIGYSKSAFDKTLQKEFESTMSIRDDQHLPHWKHQRETTTTFVTTTSTEESSIGPSKKKQVDPEENKSLPRIQHTHGGASFRDFEDDHNTKILPRPPQERMKHAENKERVNSTMLRKNQTQTFGDVSMTPRITKLQAIQENDYCDFGRTGQDKSAAIPSTVRMKLPEDRVHSANPSLLTNRPATTSAVVPNPFTQTAVINWLPTKKSANMSGLVSGEIRNANVREATPKPRMDQLFGRDAEEAEEEAPEKSGLATTSGNTAGESRAYDTGREPLSISEHGIVDISEESVEMVDVDTFEGHQVKFQNDVLETEDLQSEIESDLRNMNVSFSSQYSVLLRQLSMFIGLLEQVMELNQKANEESFGTFDIDDDSEMNLDK